MDKKVIIFDFDGTIADTFPVFVEFARSEGFDFSPEETEELRNFSMRDVIAKLDISMWKVLFLASKFHGYFQKASPRVPLFEGIVDVIRDLRESGHTLAIVTSNSRSNVENLLNRDGIYDCFETIHSERSLFGKARPLRNIMRQLRALPNDAWYVGDEVRDVEAARGAGMRSLAVSWGFNSESALRASHPDSLAFEPSELSSLLN
ncbi:MAG: HAD-IA family hydrolase [Candidatus Moranbacteria bacterium]|nr:HAD-IA family hydrolase [Candidatus Moranbacteria bacterium]